MKETIETSKLFNDTLAIIKETMSDGSKVYDVVFYKPGRQGLRISCTDEKQARDVMRLLLQTANIILW